MDLTPSERHRLQDALRNGGKIEYGVRARMGGALRRMLERLRDKGLVEGPPWKITEAGYKAITNQ